MNIVYITLMHELPCLVPYAVGFSYSLFAGLLIWYTHKHLYSRFHDNESIGWRASITGLVERGLYTGAMLAGHLEFIGLWVVLKSVAHWDRFKSDAQQAKKNLDATAKFNGYFVCTGLSIIYGLTGAYVTKWFIHCQFIIAGVVMIVLVIVHLLLNQYISLKADEEKKPKQLSLYYQYYEKKRK